MKTPEEEQDEKTKVEQARFGKLVEPNEADLAAFAAAEKMHEAKPALLTDHEDLTPENVGKPKLQQGRRK